MLSPYFKMRVCSLFILSPIAFCRSLSKKKKNCRWCLPARYMHIRLFPWVRALKKREKKATRNIYSIFQLIYVHWGLFWNEEQWQCQPNEMLHTDTVFSRLSAALFFVERRETKMRNENEVKMYKHRRRHLYLASWEFISYSFSISSPLAHIHTLFCLTWCRCLQCRELWQQQQWVAHKIIIIFEGQHQHKESRDVLIWMSHCCCWDLFNLIKISFSTLFITFYVFLPFHPHFSFPGDMEFLLSLFLYMWNNSVQFCYYKKPVWVRKRKHFMFLYIYMRWKIFNALTSNSFFFSSSQLFI